MDRASIGVVETTRGRKVTAVRYMREDGTWVVHELKEPLKVEKDTVLRMRWGKGRWVLEYRVPPEKWKVWEHRKESPAT